VEHGRSARSGVLRGSAAIVAATIVWAVACLGVASADTPADGGASSTPAAVTSTDNPTDTSTQTDTAPSDPSATSGTSTAPSDTSVATQPTDVPPAAPAAIDAADTGTSTATDTPSLDPTNTGSVTVSTGDPAGVNTTLTAADVLPSVGLMRQAVTNFVVTLLQQMPGTAPELQNGASSTGICRCTISVAISTSGDANAIANPYLPGTQTSGAPTPTAVPGPTGFVNSVSISAQGDARAQATSGNVGGGNSDVSRNASTAPGEILSAPHMGSAGIQLAVDQLSSELLTANGSVATTLDVAPCAHDCTTLKHGEVQVAVLPSCTIATCALQAPNCWASDTSAPGDAACTIAIAIAFRGEAHARVAVAPGSASTSAAIAPCGSALAGGAVAAAIAESGDAHALASMGSAPSCAAAVPDAMHPASVYSASGATGNALGVSIAGSGVAASTAASGNSGPVNALGAADTSGSNASADTGATGDAIGIALAKLSATTQVQSGNSGRADTVCTGCSGASTPNGGDAVAVAASGDTGLSFSLAVAGLQASVQSNSGDSGDSVGFVMDGNSSTNASAPTHNAPSSGTPGTALVAGRSGQTGDTIVVAIGITSWVDVLGYTGHSGPVVSSATWGESGCATALEKASPACGGAPRGSNQIAAADRSGISPGGAVNSAAGKPLSPQAVTRALVDNEPIQVTTLTETEWPNADTLRSARDETTVVTGGISGISAAAVSQLLEPAPGPHWSFTAQIGVAAIVLALIVMACRYGRTTEVKDSS
jgi:hypothetical protein